MVMKETKSDSVFSPAKPCQYYCAVANGYVPGLYRDWATAQKQVDHYSGADTKDSIKQGRVYKPKLFATSKPHTSTSTNWSSRKFAADHSNHCSPAQHLPSKVTSCPTASDFLYLDNTEAAFNLDMTNKTVQTTPTQKGKLIINTCDSCAAVIPLVQYLIQCNDKIESSHCTATCGVDNIETTLNMLSTNTKSIELKLAELFAKICALPVSSLPPANTLSTNTVDKGILSERPMYT